MKKSCSNCATCPVRKIDPKLRKVYDWSHNFPQFEACEDGTLFDGTKENVICFSSFYYQAINWREVEKTYLKNKERIDEAIRLENEKRASGGNE